MLLVGVVAWAMLPHAPVSRRALLHAASFGVAQTLPLPAVAAESFLKMGDKAATAFIRGGYDESERLWREATVAYPDEPLGWANLATTLVITASSEMTLGVPPEPGSRAANRLDEALRAIERAETLGSTDALLLNTRGNALGLMLRWDDARLAYRAATDASQRDFESIPRSNEALALFELGELAEAEKLARVLIRRDPSFRDGQALLATLLWARGDKPGAETEFAAVCDGASGSTWCGVYSSEDAVKGRWSPKAVGAFRGLLDEPSIKLLLRNAKQGELLRERVS